MNLYINSSIYNNPRLMWFLVLEEFELEMPVAVLELNLSELFNIF